jgi:hypothetical protein
LLHRPPDLISGAAQIQKSVKLTFSFGLSPRNSDRIWRVAAHGRTAGRVMDFNDDAAGIARSQAVPDFQWSLSREDVSERVRQQIGTKKFILTVIWGANGFHVADLMTSQRSFNSEYFISRVLDSMVAKVSPRGRIPHIH